MDNNMEDNNETNEIGKSAEVLRQKRMSEKTKGTHCGKKLIKENKKKPERL